MATTEGWNIPEDLIVNEILIRLPVKSLLRFRCVCKAWRSAISNRDLIKSHRQHSQSKVHLLHGGSHSVPPGAGGGFINIERLNEEGKSEYYYRLPSTQKYGILNSSHDLVALINKDGYMLSNPAMQDLVYLPRPPSWGVGVGGFLVTGFGLVSSHGKYKVVNIRCNNDTEDICEVFTVGIDNSWRKGKSPPSPLCPHDHTPYVDGNLHMVSLESKGSWNVMAILQFNLEKEAWSVMALPDETKYIRWDVKLREIQGLLSFTCCNLEKSIEIWMLRDYANKVWSKDFVIDITPSGGGRNLGIVFFVFPLEVMTDGRILLQMSGPEWFYFDPRDGRSQLADQKDFSATAIYAENLVPVLGF
uniref:Uncharacterized protein n=1 Tax=Avena sativa TaxID=4498 RepID=A0ACD5YRJ5_AVESA